ncbi:MAG: DUF481 domain-containing protein [Acidobacteria bacterium]|nr:DUF481 domain-containing protein [Acidobacteriota bacterium]
MIAARLCLSAAITILAAIPLAAASDDLPIVTLRLSDGTVLVGRVVSEAEGKLRVRTALLGEIEIDDESVVDRTPGPVPHDAAANPVTPPTEPPAAPTAKTVAVSWTRSVSIGGSFISAPYEQGEIDEGNPGYTGKALGLPGEQLHAQFNLNLLRSGPADRWSLDSSFTFVDAQPTGRLTQAFKLDSTYSRLFHGRDFVFSNTAFRRDVVRNIDNSIVQSFGVGREFAVAKSRVLNIMPGVLVQREEKETIYDADVMFGFGFMETFSITNSRGVALDQRLIAKTLVEDLSLYSIDAYVGVRAPLTKRMMLQAGLQFDHDEMLGLQQTKLPGTDIILYANKKSSLQLTTGIQIGF